MLLSRFPALLKIERMGVGIAVIAIVGGVAWTSRDPQVKGLAARLLSTQQTRVERLRAMLEPPPGLREGSLAPAVAQKYQGRIIVALPDCPPCVADTVNRFVAQLPERSAPIVLIPKGRMADVKDQPFARFAEEVDPSFFSAFHLTSSSPPYVLQLDEGRVKWCRPLSASHALLERWTAQSSNDLGAQTDQTVGAQKATNPKKEEKRK